MAHSSNRSQAIAGKVDRNKTYQIEEALGLVKEAALLPRNLTLQRFCGNYIDESVCIVCHKLSFQDA